MQMAASNSLHEGHRNGVPTDIHGHNNANNKTNNVVRFIWLTDPPDVKSTRSCMMRIMPVVVTTSSNPFELRATIRNYLEEYKVTQSHSVNILKDSVYVDD